MIPTHFGILVAAIAIFLLWRASILSLLQMTLLFSLMGGSAAIILSGLGGSTIQPAIFALGFLFVKSVLPGAGQAQKFEFAVKDLAFLAVFIFYGIAGALILPRIFAGVIDVTPLRPIPDGYIYAAYPLGFSSQNITTAVYLFATFIAALGGHIACQKQNAEVVIAKTAATICAVHALLGLSSVALAGTAWVSVLQFFRNGFYAQLDQAIDGFVRMNGIWPEPAVFSAYGFAWLAFTTELWLRNVEPKWTGPGAAILAFALLISTSTTAYIGLSAYAIIIALRMIFFPVSVSMRKALILLSAGMSGVAAILALLAVSPDTAASFADFVAKFTVDKASSSSALQRGFWAKQGIDAFWATGGLGAGPGSFRSSSIITAIIGSTGLIGVVALLIHLVRVFKPHYKSTYLRVEDQRRAAGVAASWAAVIMLIPAGFSAASPDPGFVWGFFCGFALALRQPTFVPLRPSKH
ncbi:hypothetical protein LC612_34670 [Nostoc sp. CHAB 5834]|nr:hypothetical protein [Nostoc sp. CHAB 5834]